MRTSARFQVRCEIFGKTFYKLVIQYLDHRLFPIFFGVNFYGYLPTRRRNGIRWVGVESFVHDVVLRRRDGALRDVSDLSRMNRLDFPSAAEEAHTKKVSFKTLFSRRDHAGF